MQTHIQTYTKKIHTYIEQLRDMRMLGLALFAGAVLLLSWSGVKVIDTNYGLQRQISELQQENDVQGLTNKNLELQNKYYETDQYLDLSARRNFGLATPGETVWTVPKNVALAHTVDLPDTEKASAQATQKRQPAYQRNFQAWIDFLLHRNKQAKGV